MSNHFTLIVGTVLGASEYVADAISTMLQEQGHSTSILLEPALENIPEDSIWIVCTSTHGAGELPDNIQPFAKQLVNANLPSVSAYVIGLGDSSYDTFCYGAQHMQKALTEAGVTLLQPPFEIDVLHHPIPEDTAVEWLKEQLG